MVTRKLWITLYERQLTQDLPLVHSVLGNIPEEGGTKGAEKLTSSNNTRCCRSNCIIEYDVAHLTRSTDEGGVAGVDGVNGRS